MAREVVSRSSRHDLLELEDRLVNEGFQFLLTLLPRELFQLHNRNIIINEAYSPLRGLRESPTCYEDGDLSSENLDPFMKFEIRVDPMTTKRVRIGEKEISAFNKIPPLSWHGPPDSIFLSSQDHREQTIALIRYFLLVSAADNHLGTDVLDLPQPDYKHLVAALARLMTTYHYKTKEAIHEDGNGLNLQISQHKEDDLRSLNKSRPDFMEEASLVQGKEQLDNFTDLATQSTREASVSSTSSHQSGENRRHQAPIGDAKLPTPHQSPKEPALDLDMVNSADVSTREASVVSGVGSMPGVELSAVYSLDTDVVMTLETDSLARRSLPTPDTLVEESVVEDSDPTLIKIRKEMGSDTLSLLPNLNSCTFKPIHTDQAGYLSLRLLLGTLHDASRAQLDGSHVWASFKMHDKGARAAPRMNVHAFRADTDHVVDDDLKIKDVLPNLKLGPAFKGIHGGERPEELQLKALVKYYFIIAARSKILGFDKHYMPFNGSFVEQLKIVCKRLQTHGSLDDDRRIESRSVKRLKRFHDRTPRMSASLSDADDDAAPAARTRDARRSGRHTGQPSSRAVSESEDYVPALPSSATIRVPRRLALGTKITLANPGVNEFLDPDAAWRDSDGDSGDEIPGAISAVVSAFLEKRQVCHKQLASAREVVKLYKARVESVTMGIRKVKGMMKSVTDPGERKKMERSLAFRQMHLQAIKTHLAVKENGLAGWKARRKELDDDARSLQPRAIEAWEGLEKD